MTPISAIAIIFAVQILGYVAFDKYKLSNWKYLILGLSLIGYLFVLPNYFFPDNPNNEKRCGMPALAITLIFWILGCGSTIITYLIYLLFRNLTIKKTAHNIGLAKNWLKN
ncbi:hypothetical protein EON73_04735 [bacterium]|nr:MAG: hypothetical protein EON73_04735 [bacterium]